MSDKTKTNAGLIEEISALRQKIQGLEQANPEPKLPEEAIRENGPHYRRLFEHSMDAILLTDPDGGIMAANPEACRMFGATEEELRQLGRAGVVDVHDPRLIPALQERARTGMFKGELMLIRKDGTKFPGELTSVVFQESGGNTRTSMIIRDITNRKLAESALRESEGLYHCLFENMLNGFAYCRMLFDQEKPRDFVFLSVNSAFASLTGLKNVVGKKVSEVIPGILGSDAGLLEIYGRVARTGKPEKFERYVEALKMWFLISVYSPEKEYFVALFDVITERRQAEEAREATLDLLRICNSAGDLLELMSRLTRYFQQLTGCEAVGVRLQ